MQRELSTATWPLPWWVVVAPALTVAGIAAVTMMQPGEWAYVAPSRVSGLPGEALLVAGPVVGVAATWVAERFADRNSPLASPVLPRAAGAQALRMLCVLMVGLGAAFLLVCGLMLGWWAIRATGGTFYPIELVVALLRLEFFVVSGFLIGAYVARWHAVLWSVAWSALWVLVLPIEYASLFQQRRSLLEYFLFPASSATYHDGLETGIVLLVSGWWVAVLGALTVLTAGWFALIARRSRATFGAGLVMVAAVSSIGAALPAMLPSPFVVGDPPPLACADGNAVRVCVSREQRVLLSELVAATNETLDKLGDHIPAEVTVVASRSAATTLAAEGVHEDEIVALSVGTSNGLDDPAFRIGVGLAGLSACENVPGIGEAARWAFAFASWLAPESEYADPADINPLRRFDDETVLRWYSDNYEALRSCNYRGDGPP